MLSAEQASAIVLDLHDGHLRDDGRPERFVIQSCELSADGDYWVVRCNSEDYVVRGMTEYCYVGVNAHLVHVETGALDTVISCVSVEEHLQDKRDLQAAAGNSYVLCPAFSRTDKPAVLNLRRKLACSYPDSFALLSDEGRQWLTGTRRYLEDAQRLLALEGIETTIELRPEPNGAIVIGPETWHVEAVLKAMRKRLEPVTG